MVKIIISFEGVQGTSKSTAAVAFAYNEYAVNKKRVIANDHLNFPRVEGVELPTHFDIAWFIEHLVDGELENCVLFLDEMYQIADSRSSATKLNKLFTYFIVQTRKRGVDLYVCTHHLDHLDLRLRRAVDIRGACRYYPESPCRKCKCKTCGGKGKIDGFNCPDCHGVGGTGEYKGEPCDRCKGYGELGWSRVNFLDRRLRRRYTSDDLLGGPIFGPDYWHMFNTRERIPIQARIIAGIDTSEVV